MAATDFSEYDFPPKFEALLNEAQGNDNHWLFDVDEDELAKRLRDHDEPEIDEEYLATLKDVTYLDYCLNNPLEFYHGPNKESTTVYILGTDHEHFVSERYIKTAFEEISPELIAIEDNFDFESEKNHDTMMNLMRKHGGRIQGIIDNEDIKTLKKCFCYPWDEENEETGEILLSWGHLNNIDSLVPFYLAENHDIRIKTIDVCDDVFDRKLEAKDSCVWKTELINYEFGFNVDEHEPPFDVDNFLDFLEAAEEELTMDRVELALQLQLQYNPHAYVTETHLRDFFMATRLQDICKGNPGKRILCLCGADHVPGVRDFFHKRMPGKLRNIISNTQKSKKQLWKELRKYGCDRNNLIDLEKLQNVGVAPQ